MTETDTSKGIGILSAKELHKAFKSGAISPVVAARRSLGRAARTSPTLNCFITRLDDSAIAQAEESAGRYASKTPLGVLDGIPFAIKDIFYVSGVRCTAGSKILEGNVATYDSPLVARLKSAGAVLIGTTNLHEFAAGVTGDNPHFGPVRNPWNAERMAGGSSGGSAAAVSAGIVPAALGTDTGGSVRIPASLCGVIGFKPTYGRVSRLGVVPLAPSLDTVGILARSSWDAAAFLQAVSGHQEGDPTTVDIPVPDFPAELDGPLPHSKVGIPSGDLLDSVDPSVRNVFSRFLDRLEEMGWGVEEVAFDGWEEAARNWVPIRRAEATAFHLRWLQTVPELYGKDVRDHLEKGKEILAVDYINAVNSRPSLMDRFTRGMEGLDFLAIPTTRVAAPPLGASSVSISGKQVGVYPALNSLTLPFNMIGFPAVSIPCGLSGGLPIGAQLVGRPFEESLLLRAVRICEEKIGFLPEPQELP